MDSRFMTAAVRGMTKLLKTIINRRKARSTTRPTKRGSFADSTCAKSTKVAVVPPTRMLTPEVPSALGIVSVRRWLMRLVVAASWGDVVGYTVMEATVTPGWVGLGTRVGPTTFLTPGCAATSTATVCTTCWAEAESASATSSSGPLKPGPNPADSMSKA
jgi:hypothetical protein